MNIREIKTLILNYKFYIFSFFIFLVFIIIHYFVKNTLNIDIILFYIVISSLPTLVYNYFKSKIEQEKLKEFIRFSLDLTELLRSGITLPVALKEISKNTYGIIDDNVKRLAYRIRWGISIEESFNIFKNEINNNRINKIIDILVDTYKSGGDIGKTLNSLVTSIVELDRLAKQRESSIYENILHSYIVFVFFLGVTVVIVGFMIPFLEGTLNVGNLRVSGNNLSNIKSLMFHLAIIQSFFSGIMLGKMYKGSYRSGLKHTVIFLLMVLLTFKIIIPLISRANIVFSIPSI